MRRLRHSRTRARRRARGLLRPFRAAAPRPGVGRDRGLRPRPADGAARHGPRHAGLRRAEAQRPARRHRDRPHALLDHRLDALGERAAADPARARAHGRARAQRQPRQRDGAARAARGRGRHARHDLRHRADRGADRERRGAARGRRRRRDGPARRRVLGGRALERDADRLPRPARLPAALPRSRRAWRVAARLRVVRARPRRRRAGARAGTGRAGADRRGRRAHAAGGRARRARRALHLRILLPGPPRHAARRRRGARRPLAHGRAAGRRGAGRGRPRPADPRLRHAGRDRLLARDRNPVLARA